MSILSYSQDRIFKYKPGANLNYWEIINPSNNQLIGTIKYNDYKSQLLYYDINNKLIQTEDVNFKIDDVSKIFDYKDKFILPVFIGDKRVQTRIWNKLTNEFDIYDLNDLVVGNLIKQASTQWLYKETKNYKSSEGYKVLFKNLSHSKAVTTNKVSRKKRKQKINKQKKNTSDRFLFPTNNYGQLFISVLNTISVSNLPSLYVFWSRLFNLV